MSQLTRYERAGEVVIITLDNPPVNALSTALIKSCRETLARFAADESARAAVLLGAGKLFVAGADISEFERPITPPWLPELVEQVEASERLIVAALHGVALGGGLELAMGCHYRCAVPDTKLGLPEVKLGLLPGATGVRRLPRLVGVKKSLDMMISGRPITAAQGFELGLVDKLVDAELRDAAIAYARELLQTQAPCRRVSELPPPVVEADDTFFEDYQQTLEQQQRGFFAPPRIVKCVQAATRKSYQEAGATERELFAECLHSPHSKAQRHLFFAEREVTRAPGVSSDTPTRAIHKVAVVGAGTMGSGIALCFLNAGLPVTLLDTDEGSLARGLELIHKSYDAALKRGRITPAQREQALTRLTTTLDQGAMADAELVVEAVFEDLSIKQELFARMDDLCKPEAILASNTSSLDLNAIASVTRRPESVLGLHFFAPANIMRLLEIVRGRHTAVDVIATAMQLARRLGKVGVVVGVCFGFVGNRLFLPYAREAQLMLLEGIPPERVDRVARAWGMAMGPHAVMDLSGLDIFNKLLDAWPECPADPAYYRMCRVLCELGRYGQKTGSGIYRYEGRQAQPAPEVLELAQREARRLGIEQVTLSDAEIMERLLYAMINEGARALAEGIALRPGDIDLIFVNGYGMPRYRGGPMHYADALGLAAVHSGILKYRARYGDPGWTPAPLLERLARTGGKLSHHGAQP